MSDRVNARIECEHGKLERHHYDKWEKECPGGRRVVLAIEEVETELTDAEEIDTEFAWRFVSEWHGVSS